MQGPFGPLVLNEKFRALNFFQGQIFFFFGNVFCTSDIEMNQHFHRPFGPFVLTFCGPSPNFEGNWPKGQPNFDSSFTELSAI